MSIESITVSNVMVRDVKTAKESQTTKAIFKALMKSQSLVASFCETLLVEYKPVYERLSEFILGEMPMSGGNPK